MKPKSTLSHFLALAASSLLAISSASALTYYWDNNGTGTTGFGTAGGTWADTGSTLWSGSATGDADATLGTSVITTTADSVNFGTNTALYGLAAGTINVSGTVNAKDISFGSQSGSITLSGGTINLASTAIITANGTMTIDSLITGAGTSLTKAAGGTLRLTNTANTYTGATLIGQSTGGVLEATFLANGGVASSIGASSSAAGNLVLSNINAGVLRYIGATNASTDRLFTLGNQQGYAGGFESSGTGTLNLTSTGSVAFSQANQVRIFSLGGTNTGQNIANTLLIDNGTGALSFIKSGAGTWVLANKTSSYTGSTSINGGVLSVSKMAAYGTESSIGKGAAGTAITFDDGALVYTGSGDDTDRLVRTARSGTILNNGTGALNFTAAGNFNVPVSQTLARGLSFGGTNGGTISGALQNNTGGTPALSVAKIGIGTWTLGATNTYTGNTDVNAGTLRLQSGTTTITQTLGALRNQLADGTLNSDKSDTGSITTTFSSYTRSAGATGNIVSTGGTNGTDNSVNITGAAGFINKGLYFGGSEFAARNSTDGYVRALIYGTDGSTAAVDTVTASNHVKLTTTSYSGAGVTLLSLNLASGGINWTNTSGNLTVPGIIKSGGGSLSTISGANVTGGTGTEVVIRTDTSSDLLAISSNLTQGSGALTKTGAGTLTLSGTNTYTGQTHVNAGTLSIGANVNLGSETTAATLNLKGGTLQATGTFGLYNGTAGTNNRAVTLLDQSTIEVTGSNTLTIAGVISNNGSAGVTTPGFNKTGTGALLLSGANTYTGGTTINAGTLTITGTTQATNSISFTGGSLGLNTGVTVTAARAAVDLSNGTIEVTGSTGAASYTLLTAASITGAPVLATPVPGYQLQVIDGATDELRLVQSGGGTGFATWATTGTLGPVTFEGDTNGDGVQDGMAFLLGAINPDDNAIGRLPKVSESGGNLVLSFNCLPVSARGSATLKVAHSTNLASWTRTTNVVPDATNLVPDNNVTFTVAPGPVGPPALNSVTATVNSAAAAGGKLFGRLEANP